MGYVTDEPYRTSLVAVVIDIKKAALPVQPAMPLDRSPSIASAAALEATWRLLHQRTQSETVRQRHAALAGFEVDG